MPDLLDGETMQIQGSASKPYTLKNVAGVYSCSCPAWRNQSLPIDRRTCKHIRSVRGDDAEAARLGNFLAPAPKLGPAQAPPLLLAESWDGASNPTGWHLSEKLDGVRCWWDGKQLLSRGGNRYHAPDWFTEGLPLEPLDGEFWIGRKQFQRTVSIVRRQDQSELWREVRFRIFDAPGEDCGFEARLRLVQMILDMNRPPFAAALAHVRCESVGHLHAELERVVSLGGEGLMLRQPDSRYTVGRSSTLLKVKRFHDAEALVVGHEPGAGRHRGRLGALLVQLTDGTQFSVGTGLTDSQRTRPPAIGSVITFRYQELTDGGVPRFPSFVGVRPDVPISNHPSTKGEQLMALTSTRRRFEFVGGNSAKFWEIDSHGAQVTVCFGRIGAAGQRETKTFADSAAAEKHAEMKVREKLAKGYQQID